MLTTSIVGGPSAWAGREIAGGDDWLFRLDDEQKTALLDGVGELRATCAGGCVGALATRPLNAFEVPELAHLATRLRAQLLQGGGVVLIRGLPVADLSTAECELLLWCLGVQLGVPIHQNARQELIVHVVDEGADFAHRDVRAYETAAELNYHSDSSDIVGLLCIRPAWSGGTSTVVSSTRIHDEMVRRDPAAAASLHEPWWHYNPADGSVTERPICVRQGDDLFAHYGRRYLDLGAADPRTPGLSDQRRGTLDLFDELAHDRDLLLDMDFQPGDLQLLNNYKILHSRTAYTDHPDPRRRRHLLRIWLVVPELEPPAEFVDVGIIPRTVAFAGHR